MVTTMKKTNKKGFTLVELVVVIAILAILAAIAVPTVSNIITTANTNVDAANAQTVELAIKSAYAERIGGTWDGKIGSTGPFAAEDLTYLQALKHEGIDTLPTARVAGALYSYKNGIVFLGSTTDRTAFVLTGDSITKAKDVVAVSAS